MALVGKWDMVSSDKYEDYLKAVGVGMVNRTVAAKAKPSLEYIDLGNGKWTQKTSTTFKNFEITFEVGKEFDEKTADDRDAKSVITIDGNTLTHKQTIGDITATTTRVFEGNDMTTTFSAKDVTATRKYKRV